MVANVIFAAILAKLFFLTAQGADIAELVDDYDESHVQRSEFMAQSFKARGFDQIIRVSSKPTSSRKSGLVNLIKTSLDEKNIRPGVRVLFYFNCHGSVQDKPEKKPADHILCSSYGGDLVRLRFLSVGDVRALAEYSSKKGSGHGGSGYKLRERCERA